MLPSLAQAPSPAQPQRRKLPGPAGDLQLPADGESAKHIAEVASTQVVQAANPAPMRPDQDPDFRGSSPAWNGIMEFVSGASKNNMTITEVLQGGFQKKISGCIALVKACTMVDHNMYLELKDPTGEIKASVHKDALADHPGITIGCALALQKVSVFSPTPSKHYLNIVLENIVHIVMPNGDGAG